MTVMKKARNAVKIGAVFEERVRVLPRIGPLDQSTHGPV
jgi:hypothetical protein